MKHLLTIDSLTAEEISHLVKRAIYFKQTQQYPAYIDSPVATLFYENSTRTRVSFELAAKKLSMPVIHLDVASSSESKGESLEDTMNTLAAMGIKVVVIRHKQSGLPEHLAAHCDPSIHFINAGDGLHAHPSQALLDVMTILEQKPQLDKLKIAVIGNISHSRVAHSFMEIAAKLGVGELVLVAPKVWQPEKVTYGKLTESLTEGLQGADVVMCLRIQRERLLEDETFELPTYIETYALTSAHLSLMKPDAIIMHPGPLNRGTEIEAEVADGPQSVILRQVQNGVFMRMAILEHVFT